MASTASSSSDRSSSPSPSSSHAESTSSRQAGPLPVKNGEFGFATDTDQPGQQAQGQTPEHALSRDTRHPAERSEASNASAPPSNAVPAQSEPQTVRSHKRCPSISSAMLGGIAPGTALAVIVHLIILLATIGGWAIVGLVLTRMTSSQPESFLGKSPSTVILIHVVFGLFTVVQIVFLERRIFTARAQRWRHVHSGEILPTHGPHVAASREGAALAFAPWNRPPLPSYAATLADSGVGTGDVEDNTIAIAPPPMYGKEQDDALIMSSPIRATFGAASNMQSFALPIGNVPPVRPDERPKSYVSHDEEWEAYLHDHNKRAGQEREDFQNVAL